MALDLLEERSVGFSPVIPVRLEETEVPDSLKKLQRIDLFKNDNVKKLKIALEKHQIWGCIGRAAQTRQNNSDANSATLHLHQLFNGYANPKEVQNE